MPASDLKTRQLAVSPEASFIVQAPAGSGKTELLTQRFLKLLSLVEKPENVLAITFTRKATQEMRERIMLRLRQAGQGVHAQHEHEQFAVRLAGRVLARSSELGWDLSDNPGRLQIQTIDGLCARISGRAPQPGEGITGLLVMDDARPLYRRAARRLIEDAGSEEAEPDVFSALSHILVFLKGSASSLQDMLARMLGQRDQWLSRLDTGGQHMETVLAAQQQIELEQLNSALGTGPLSKLIQSLCTLAGTTSDGDRAEQLGRALDNAASRPGDTDAATRARWQALRTVATADNRPFAPSSVKSRVLPGQDSSTEALDAVRSVLAHWRENEAACTAFKRFVSTPPLRDSEDARSVLGDFQLLLKYATAHLRVLFTEAGRADFIHVSEMALQALGDESQPGDALLFEDGSLEHILLDEFQDTSFTQFELIRRLVSGWQTGDGRSLFLVGDPMQSIYRFRKADVSLFNEVFETGELGPVRLQSLQLTANFRSRAELIHWVNQEFPRVFSPPGHASPNFVGYTPVTAAHGGGGQVLAHPFPEHLGAEGEASLIAELVADTRAKDPGLTIAILGRARVQLEFIARALHEQNQAFEAVQVESLSSRPVIVDLVMLLRAIIHPADRIAWLALLRAPWCALNPDQLLTVAGSSPADDILARMGDPGHLSELEKPTQKRVIALKEIMQAALNARHHVPMSRLVEFAWLRLKGPFAVQSRDELSNASQFFSLLAGVEDERPADLITTVLERMDRFFAGSTPSNVKLMTIHKAKGLEFDVVILPGLHRGGHRVDLPMLRIQDIVHTHGTGVLMAPKKRKDSNNPGLYDYLGLLEKEQETLESCRVLYVATTRARSQLHLFGAWKWNKKDQQACCTKGTFMELLWPYFEAQIDAGNGPQLPSATQAETPPQLPQLALAGEPDLALPLPEENAALCYPDLRAPDPDSIALGQAFHTWMELIHNHWSQGWTVQWFRKHQAALESSLLTAGASAQALKGLTSRLTAMIDRVLKDESNLSLVSPQGRAGSWAELAFISQNGVYLNRHILDRLYQDSSGRMVILDYKTGARSPDSDAKWGTQLERYVEIVESATGKVVAEAKILQSEPV